MEILQKKDSELPFPHSVILKASAGSGKTHALTKRYVQFLLSNRIKHNKLKNILALTFSNNAAKEMKERILAWLKGVYFGDEGKIGELMQVLALDRDELIGRAGTLIDEILANYTDFGVKTIDSFMVSIYKASAIDLGFSPDFEIHMKNEYLMAYAFSLYLRKVRAGAPGNGLPETEALERVINSILGSKAGDDSYIWNPAEGLLDEIKGLYRKLSAIGKRINIPDNEANKKVLETGIYGMVHTLDGLIESSGLERRRNSTFGGILENVRNSRYTYLIGRGVTNPPVKKKDGIEYDQIMKLWEDLGELIRKYNLLHAHSYFSPYLRAFEAFRDTIELVKKKEAAVFIEDINKNLSAYINDEIVPDVYFRLGETVFHYLLDEFQDTAPIQWDNLFPLIENSLSQGGSLLVVGDTKQSIYGFRNADYTIMRSLESSNPFPSAAHFPAELGTNYRSYQQVCDFSRQVFQQGLTDNGNDKYREAAGRCGLLDYKQEVLEKHKGLGYVEVSLFEKSGDEPAEKRKLQDLIEKLHSRGYRYSDIAVLTLENKHAANASAWLNERDIPFISYSSLDIRKRKFTGGIISLLKFLNSPLDDLAFITFLMGDVFSRAMDKNLSENFVALGFIPSQPGGGQAPALRNFLFTHRNDRPIYKAFQKDFSQVWETYFDRLFKTVGYKSLYDLVCEIYGVFGIFDTFKDEQATAIKLLEAIKDFEDTGRNNLGDFIAYTDDRDISDSDWDIAIPLGVDAVRVMTVFKAKGLGFPVTIVLLYNEQNKGFDYIFHENGEGIDLLRITRDIANLSPVCGEIYAEEEIRELVNRLNALYVGFTRAESELYVIGVGEQHKRPLDLLPKTECQPIRSADPAAGCYPVQVCPGCDISVQFGADLKVCTTITPSPHICSSPINRGTTDVAGVRGINLEEKNRGTFIHRLLYSLDYVDGNLGQELERIIGQTNISLGRNYPVDVMMDSLLGFFANDIIREYFKPKAGRVILKEQNFSDINGNLFRMDRVVVDDDIATVIDFKTGHEHNENNGYELQVRKYINLLRDVFPGRKTEGIIAYVDLKEIRYVR